MMLKILLAMVVGLCGCGDFNLMQPDEEGASCFAYAEDECSSVDDCCEGQCIVLYDFILGEFAAPQCIVIEEEEPEELGEEEE